MHECHPIEGSPRTHWAESDGNGRTVLDDKRYQHQASINQHQASINSTLPTLMTTRFLTLWIRLLAEGAISLLHGALAILKSAATISQTWTTVEQERDSHHYDSVKAAIRQVTKAPPTTLEHLRCIYGERGEEVKHKLESRQLSRNDQVSISRLRSGHHADLKYWLHMIGIAFDTVFWKCGMGRRQLNM